MRNIIEKLFIKESNNVFVQLFRYTFVGGFAFLVDFGALWFLTEICGLHYLLSATIAFMAGLLVNYFISILWVFTSSKHSNRKLEFLYFGLIGIIGLGLNDLFIWIFTEKIGTHYLVSKIITAILVYLWNFFARKYLLFNTEKLLNEDNE